MQKLKQNASEVASQVELLEIRFLLRAAMLRLRVRSDVNAAKSFNRRRFGAFAGR